MSEEIAVCKMHERWTDREPWVRTTPSGLKVTQYWEYMWGHGPFRPEDADQLPTKAGVPCNFLPCERCGEGYSRELNFPEGRIAEVEIFV